MKIQAIRYQSNLDKQYSNQSNTIKPNSFKGIVNGKYYKDEIIEEAKKALKNPNWKDRFLSMKKSAGESLASWHKREGDDLAGRVLMGVFTLGLTEITWGLSAIAMDAMDNKDIDKKIREIEECMDDLSEGGSGEI